MLAPPCLALSTPANREELLNWMENGDFAPYRDAMEEALSTCHLTPEGIWTVPAKELQSILDLPTYGMALDLKWATTEGNSQRLQCNCAPLAALDEVGISKWLDSVGLVECAIQFLGHSVTGKGAEVVQSTDMKALGLEDTQMMLDFFQARDSFMADVAQTALMTTAAAQPPLPPPPTLPTSSQPCSPMAYAKASPASAPTTPDRTSSKRKQDAMSPSKTVNPWSKVKGCMGLPGVVATGPATKKGTVMMAPFGVPKSCEEIWENDLVDQTVRIAMMQCQAEVVKNSKWRRLELYFYALSERSAWVRFELLDDAAHRFLRFKEAHLVNKPASFLEMSCVTHGRGKGNELARFGMAMRVGAQCQFKEFSPCSAWEDIGPDLCMDFQHLSGAPHCQRLFFVARVAEVDDVVPPTMTCSARRVGSFMDKLGNKRSVTIWDPVATSFPWAVDQILTILGARCSRTKYGVEIVMNSDVCIMEHSASELADFSKIVKSRDWDFCSPRPLDFSRQDGYGDHGQ